MDKKAYLEDVRIKYIAIVLAVIIFFPAVAHTGFDWFAKAASGRIFINNAQVQAQNLKPKLENANKTGILSKTQTITPTNTSASPQYEYGTVNKVLSGNTLSLKGGEIVRLAQIDAPASSRCGASIALGVLRGLLKPGTIILMRRDPSLLNENQNLQFVRYVWRAKGRTFINARLLTLGAASAYFEKGARGHYASRFERIALEAQNEGVGLWRSCYSNYDPYRHVGR